MSDQKFKIQVPERKPDEVEATAEQLQFIRHLVSGMSLSGFRFDYRKLGKWQASEVIDQLIQIRDAQGLPPAKASSGSGIGRSIRRVALLSLLIGIIGGGIFVYLNPDPFGARGIVDQINSAVRSNSSQDPVVAVDENTPPVDTTESGPRLVDSLIFPGLKVEERPDPHDRLDGDTNTSPESAQPDPQNTADTPDSTNPTPPSSPEPALNSATRSDIKQIENLLVNISQFTRTEYEQVDRLASVKLMQERLVRFTSGLSAIEKLNPTLAQRIQSVIRGYGDPTIDGQAIRDEITSIREAMNGLE